MVTIYPDGLLKTPTHIRLLQLRPGRKADALCCRFLTCSLDSPDLVPYHALSYCWGDAEPSETIFVAGLEAKITPNLHSALLHLRKRRKAFILWVDALCINQEDLDEKRVQIMQMTRIYRSADQVIVWLGDGNAETQHAMDLLKCGYGGIDYGHPAVFKLLQRPWFTRIWVLQEIAMASKDPIIRCGSDEMSWSDLRQLETEIPMVSWVSFLLFLKPKEAKNEEFGRLAYDLAQIRTFLGIVRYLRTDHLLSWQDGLMLRLFLSASDERDLIYGLLGVLRHEDSPMLPDYSLDSGYVLRSAAARALETCAGLEALTLTAPASGDRLPSWVPDVSNGSIGLFLASGSMYYRTAGMTVPMLRWSHDFSILHTQGVVIDTISDIAVDDKGRLNHSRQLARKTGIKYQYSDDKVTEWYWRTMIANQGRYSAGATAEVTYPAPVEFGSRFLAMEREIPVPENLIGEGIRFEWEMEYFKPWSHSVSVFSEHGQSHFFVTRSGRFGLGQHGARKGDLVCILSGGRIVVLLRKNKGHYKFVGCAYVHGVMDSENASLLQDESEAEEFEIH